MPGDAAPPAAVLTAETSPELVAAAPAPPAPAPPTTELPVRCRPVGELCLPPADFVERLCRGSFPGLALAMFQKSSEWTRGYFTIGLMDPVNTLGGPRSDAQLARGEELIVLHRRGDGAGSGGMQMSGYGGYFVLRWDGTCATLMDGELSLKPPGTLRNPPVPWKYVDDNLQQVLLERPEIQRARDRQRKQCRGAGLGAQGKACQQADKELSDRIVAAVRGGLTLPVPQRLP